MAMRALIDLVRPFTLLAPIVGVGSGYVVAQSLGGATLGGVHLALAFMAAALATAASNAWNQAFDADVDRINKPGRPVPRGAFTVRQASGYGHVGAALAVACAWLAEARYVPFVLIGLALTWLYSAPPVRLKRHPVGALLSIAVARGLLVPVAGWSLSQSVDVFEPWCLGAIVGLFTFGAAATKDFADIEGDRAYGCRTLPVVLGPRQAARLIALFLWVPFGLYPLFAWAGWLTPSVSAFAVLGVALTLLGGATGVSLMRAPTATAGGRNHTAWAMMYLLMLGAHAGVALVYRGA